MGVRVFSKCLYGACVVCWFFIVLNVTAQPAHAYVDPGSGLFLFQVAGSTFAGTLFLLRKRIRNFFERFGRRSLDVGSDLEQR